MSRYRKITTICCAAVFALGLSACGGGSDDGLSATEEEALRQQVTDAEAAKQKAEDDKAAAEAAKKKAEDDAAAAKKKADDEEAARKKAAEDAAMAAMIVTAAKLHAGIGAPTDDPNSDNAARRHAAYNAAGTAITVTSGAGTDIAVTLNEDKKTMVADNHGWEGKRYADKAGGPMVEAMVYSNVGDPTPGMAFEKQYNADFNDGVLDTDITEHSDHAGKVASDQFDHTAGFKEFKKGENREYVEISGSFHGVSGTYRCNPGAAGTNCAVSVATEGFTLGATASGAFTAGSGEWTFKPADPKAMVMSSPDGAYASYGWWIHKSENDKTYMASAFTASKGGPAAATGLDALNGKATYMGGAAGKYALTSSTGGTNDAGHFTAMVALEADFNVNDGTNTTGVGITGMIDNFMGADGMPRDWSVKLNGSSIGDDGEIGAAAGGTAMTVWTIGEDAAKAAGSWTGTLSENKNDVPQVATGTFYTDYGTAGKMVGAFGANVQ